MKRMMTGAWAGLTAGALLGLLSLANAQDRQQDAIAEGIARKNERIWVLDFRPEKLDVLYLKEDTGDTEVYWYLTYTVTNRDEVAHPFFLDLTAQSDRGRRSHRYHDIWIPDVYDEVRDLLGLREGDQLLSQRDLCMPPPGERNQPPRLDDQRTRDTATIALPVIQPQQTLRCVAIFKPLDGQMDRLTVFVRGLTNSSLHTHDDYVAPADRPQQRVITEAVLTLEYRRPGDEFSAQLDRIEYVGRRWIDETRTILSDLR